MLKPVATIIPSNACDVFIKFSVKNGSSSMPWLIQSAGLVFDHGQTIALSKQGRFLRAKRVDDSQGDWATHTPGVSELGAQEADTPVARGLALIYPSDGANSAS